MHTNYDLKQVSRTKMITTFQQVIFFVDKRITSRLFKRNNRYCVLLNTLSVSNRTINLKLSSESRKNKTTNKPNHHQYDKEKPNNRLSFNG